MNVIKERLKIANDEMETVIEEAKQKFRNIAKKYNLIMENDDTRLKAVNHSWNQTNYDEYRKESDGDNSKFKFQLFAFFEPYNWEYKPNKFEVMYVYEFAYYYGRKQSLTTQTYRKIIMYDLDEVLNGQVDILNNDELKQFTDELNDMIKRKYSDSKVRSHIEGPWQSKKKEKED